MNLYLRVLHAFNHGQFWGIACVLIPLFAWLTHVIYCIAMGFWGFLIAGAIFFPIGIIHGIYIWLLLIFG